MFVFKKPNRVICLRTLAFFLISVNAVTLSLAEAVAGSFTFTTPYVARGIGIEFTVPRIKEAIQHTFPLPVTLERGGNISPIFQDIYPCQHFLCSRKYAGMLLVMISRHSEPDTNLTALENEQARNRAETLMRSSRESRARNLATSSEKKASRLVEESLHLKKIGDAYWAIVRGG